MGYLLKYRNELPEPLAKELEELFIRLEGFLSKQHNPDGTHNFGLPVGNHSGESASQLTPINFGSQSFINSLDPGFLQMFQTVIGSGLVTDELTFVINQLIDSGDIITSEVFEHTFSITEAQLENMTTVPFELLPAPGASGKWVPIALDVHSVCPDSYTNAPTLQVVYQGSTTAVMDAISPAYSSGVAHNRRIGVMGITVGLTESTFDPRGKALMLRTSSTLTGVGKATLSGNLLYTLDTESN